jgi:hypothetical protein
MTSLGNEYPKRANHSHKIETQQVGLEKDRKRLHFSQDSISFRIFVYKYTFIDY